MLSFSGFSYQRQQERDRKEIKHMKNRLHVKAPGNWVNDPNGMIYYKDSIIFLSAFSVRAALGHHALGPMR